MSRDLPDMPIGMLDRKSSGGQRKLIQDKPVMVRMPAELFAHLEACANAAYRTVPAEIRARLESSVEGESLDEHGVIVRILRRPLK